MNIRQIIDKADDIQPNQYSEEEKIEWLSNLDGMIHRDVIQTHEGWDGIQFIPYTDSSKNLIADAPFTEMYVNYLLMKIDEANKDTQRYNNSALLFNAHYDAFTKDYNRMHMPIKHTKLRIY